MWLTVSLLTAEWVCQQVLPVSLRACWQPVGEAGCSGSVSPPLHTPCLAPGTRGHLFIRSLSSLRLVLQRQLSKTGWCCCFVVISIRTLGKGCAEWSSFDPRGARSRAEQHQHRGSELSFKSRDTQLPQTEERMKRQRYP